MNLLTKAKQLYRYHRNWRKLQHRLDKDHATAEAYSPFYSQFISQGDLCYDVGANVGDKTEMFLQLGAKVIAIEPQESCWRVLKRRYKNNPNVRIITRALDRGIGSRAICVDRSPTISSMSPGWIESVKKSGRFSGHDWDYTLTIKTTTLDHLIEQFGPPAFCKIDVEGFEFEVLQGLSQPISSLSFEFISEYLDPVLNCIRHLAKLGQPQFNYTLADSMHFALSAWIDAEPLTEHLHKLTDDSMVQGDIYVKFPGSQSDNASGNTVNPKKQPT